MDILLRLLTFLPDSVFQNNAVVLLLGGLVMVLLLVLLLWGMIGNLIFRIVNPTILRHPWPLRHEPGDQQRIVVLAGSYNPPHNGHLAMLSYLAERCVCVLAWWFGPNRNARVGRVVRFTPVASQPRFSLSHIAT